MQAAAEESKRVGQTDAAAVRLDIQHAKAHFPASRHVEQSVSLLAIAADCALPPWINNGVVYLDAVVAVTAHLLVGVNHHHAFGSLDVFIDFRRMLHDRRWLERSKITCAEIIAVLLEFRREDALREREDIDFFSGVVLERELAAQHAIDYPIALCYLKLGELRIDACV